MKKAMSTLTVVVMALSMMACGQDEGSKRTNVTDRNQRNNDGDPAREFRTFEAGKWGQVYRGEFSDTEFEDEVQRFTSATMDPFSSESGLGEVDGDIGGSTGIWFTGNIAVSGRFDGSQDDPDIDARDSSLVLVVWDSIASRADEDSEDLGYYFSKKGASKVETDGDTVEIHWEDEFGTIILFGVYDRELFEGRIYYDNKTNKSEEYSSAQSGELGTFVIPTCNGMFECRD